MTKKSTITVIVALLLIAGILAGGLALRNGKNKNADGTVDKTSTVVTTDTTEAAETSKPMEDLPYYNGFYSNIGEPCLVGSPNSPYLKAAITSGGSLWDAAGLSENDTADIFLNQAGKYQDIQNSLDLEYKNDRSAFKNDEAFANFRNIHVGNIGHDLVPMLKFLSGDTTGADLTSLDYEKIARSYLENGGMTNEEIEKLIDRLS